jgi:outer membrane cobalamin receptor
MPVETIFMQIDYVFFRICFYCACFQLFTVASAQNADTVKTIRLQDVEVVGQGRMSVTKQSSPVQIMDDKTIRRIGINDLSEAVKRFSGVTVKDYGGIGGLKTVSVRSLGAHHTAVGYDGIAVSDAQSGQIDISRFTLDNAEYVALSTGQTDDIFLPARLFASAGVINIKTRKPDFQNRKSKISLKLKSGSFGLINPYLSYSQKISDKWNATLNTGYKTAKGDYSYILKNGTVISKEKRMNSDIESGRVEADIRGQTGDNGLFNMKLYTYHSERGLPGSVHFYDKTATERLWDDVSFIQTHYKNVINRRFSVQAAAKYNYSYSRYLDVSDKYSSGKQEDKNTQQEIYGSAGLLFSPSEYFSTSVSSDYSFTVLENNFINSPQPQRNTSLTVWAGQYKNSCLTVTGSVLYSLYRDKIQTAPPKEKAGKAERFSPALSLSWQPFDNKDFRVRASYKDGFRVPTFTDLYYLRVGNTNLKPERSKQFNAGFTWNGEAGKIIKNMSFTADGYYNKIDNKIVAIPTLYIWKMMNLGMVDIKGLDVNLTGEIPLTDKINIFVAGNYSFQNAIDITDSQAKNYKNQIPYTPQHSGSGSVSLENQIINISYLVTATGERFSLPQNIEANKIGAYTEHNISMNKTLNFKGFTLRLQGEIVNVFNAQYDVIQYYPMPGRSWRVSLEIRR